MNTILKTNRSADGLSTMLALSIGLALAFLMVIAAPSPAHAQYSDFGDSDFYYGDTGCGYGCDQGYSDFGDSDFSYGNTGCGYSCDGGYYDDFNSYTYPTYSYVPYDSGSLNISYTNNENHNTNNNTNVVTVNTPSTPTYTCAQFGMLGAYPNCYNQHNPTCADLGQTGTYPNCHSVVHHDEDVSCNLDASDTSIDDGDRTTLEWDTDGDVTYASINQGIGRVDEDGGTERVSPDEDTTYKLTVRNDDGDEDTCSVTIRVDEDANNDFSSRVFTSDEPQNPPSVVYLSSIPYTGLEDVTPEMWAYWLLLVAGVLGAAWFFFGQSLLARFSFTPASGAYLRLDDAAEETAEEAPAEEAASAQAFVSMLASDDASGAVDAMREAAANGTGVEEFLEEARATVADADPLAAKLDSAIAESRKTGIRGAKIALGF